MISAPLNSPSNIHNLNLLKTFEMGPGHPFYSGHEGFRNLTVFLNPLFYAGLCGFWIGLPLLKERTMLGRRLSMLALMPTPSVAIQKFFFGNVIVFILIDKASFNVGFVFEASLSIVAVLVAVDMNRTREDGNTEAAL